MSDNFTENTPKLPSHYAYTVKEGKGNKAHFSKIGAAWPAKDNGLTIDIAAMPLDGKIHLRSREALERMREERAKQHVSPQDVQSLTRDHSNME